MLNADHQLHQRSKLRRTAGAKRLRPHLQKRMRETKSGTLTVVDEVRITPHGARIFAQCVQFDRIFRADF
jgi:hypothetical protein